MICATTKVKFKNQFIFNTNVFSKVENAMYQMGYGCCDYYLHARPVKNAATTRIKILDRHGFEFIVG